jgi:DNA polymerase III subunit delta'
LTVTAARDGGLVTLVGQDEAVRALRAAAARPVHAYLLVGPPGTGKLAAARALAALLVCPSGGDDGCSTCRRVAEGLHPDVVVFEREGAALTIDQAREVARVASRSSVEGGRTVVVLPDIHLAREAAPALLKTIEEPPPGTVFIIVADFVPPELATIASRCAQVAFRPLTEAEVAAALEAEGTDPPRAAALAALAGGRLDRARLLAADPDAEGRHRAWGSLPGRLDGTGATVATLVDELMAHIERSAAPLLQRQEAEAAEVVARANRGISGSGPAGRGVKGPGRSVARELEERHRREQRRHRAEELRSGLAALARAYRDRGTDGRLTPAVAARAVALVDELSADLAYNPGEVLALQSLLVRLDRVEG